MPANRLPDDEAEISLESGGTPDRRPKYLSAFDIQLRREKDPILEALPHSAKLEYLRVKGEVRRGLVDGLAKTLRWQNSPYRVNPQFHETDLDHVLGLLGWCSEIERDYPALYEAVSGGDRETWHDFLAMITIHDIGEIRLGDVVLPNQGSSDGRHRKKLEPRWAKLALRKSLEPQLAQKLISIYDRFEQPADDDTLALTARMLDKAQASANVARHLIPFNTDNPDYMSRTFVDSQADALRLAERLTDRLQSPQAQTELQKLLKEKLIEPFHPLEIAQISSLQQQVRERFPHVYSEEWLT